LLGIGLNEWIRRSNRIETYAGAVYKERFDVYVNLWKIIRDGKPKADQIINDAALSAEARHKMVSVLVLKVAAFCDENSLYLNEDVTVHCCTVFMGVEEIADEPDTKKRDKKTLGFVAKSGIRTDKVRVHADHGDKSVQRAPISRRGHSASRTVVSAISVGLRACRRAIGRARPGSGCQLCLALGASLLAGIEQALPTPSQAHQQELPCRRDLYKG
jgi:hypothetical protein